MSLPSALTQDQDKKAAQVMIVEDDEAYRETLHRLFRRFLADQVEVVGEADNAQLAVRRARIYRPDLMLFDLCIPLNPGERRTSAKYGIAAIRVISHSPWGKAIRILVLSNLDAPDYEETICKAIRAGAHGYLVKAPAARASGETIARSVEKMLRGQSVFDPEVETLSRESGAGDLLSPRQTQVATLITHGKTNDEIADELGISLGAVRVHVEKVLDKLNINSRHQVKDRLDDFIDETYGLEYYA